MREPIRNLYQGSSLTVVHLDGGFVQVGPPAGGGFGFGAQLARHWQAAVHVQLQPVLRERAQQCAHPVGSFGC